ncbi:MAG: ABC transporter substrate-binding protein [Thermotogota bacterium]|nr:ABC transporter substrate-binding protein [Thermotogota bacterium]
MKKIAFSIIIISLLIIVLFISFRKGPVLVGFAGSLSSKNAPLGIAVKDGVLLALEEINAENGINGRELELVIKDDENNPQTAVRVDAELIKEGVCTIIGHVTSAMTEAALSQANEKQMLLLSPTTSSISVLDGDDNLISIHPPNIYEQEALAQYAIKQFESISIIYDADNKAFSEGWVSYFSSAFQDIGGKVDAVYGFSAKNTELYQATNELLAKNPQAVLIVASAIDTANICQQIEKKFPKQVLKLSSGWALDSALIEQGGLSVNGLILPSSWDRDSTNPAYLAFKEAFIKRYKRDPQFAETYGYEAIMVLSEALKSGVKPEPMKIREKILSIGEFHGLQSTISIDQMGKTKRDVFLFTVENNSFKRITD